MTSSSSTFSLSAEIAKVVPSLSIRYNLAELGKSTTDMFDHMMEVTHTLKKMNEEQPSEIATSKYKNEFDNDMCRLRISKKKFCLWILESEMYDWINSELEEAEEAEEKENKSDAELLKVVQNDENSQLKKENETLKADNEELNKENERWIKENEEQDEQLRKLKKENDKLKKDNEELNKEPEGVETVSKNWDRMQEEDLKKKMADWQKQAAECDCHACRNYMKRKRDEEKSGGGCV